MELIGEAVAHGRFGRGIITGAEPGYIDVKFEAEDKPRRFAYPGAFRDFLSFEREAAAEQARRDMASASVQTQQDILRKIEADRVREERLTAMRLEEQRRRRADSAKKAAERRKAALAMKSKQV